MTSFAKATRQFRNFMPTIYPGSNYFPRLEITRSFTFISSTHERDNFFLPIVLYTFYTFEIYYPRNARKKAFARSWNILLASRRWVDWKFLNATIIDQLSKGSVSKFESFEISSLLDAIISFPLPLRLNNKFDGAKQSIFERFEKIPFSRKHGKRWSQRFERGRMNLLTKGSTFNLLMWGTDLLLRACGRALCTKWYSVWLPNI